jgi:hypothetical protein
MQALDNLFAAACQRLASNLISHTHPGFAFYQVQRQAVVSFILSECIALLCSIVRC